MKEVKREISVVKVAKEVEDKFETPSGDVMSLEEYLVWLGNKILRIEGAVC